MKYVMSFSFILLLFSLSFSKITVGIDGRYVGESDKKKEETVIEESTTYTSNQLYLYPWVGIYVSEVVELSPRLIVGFFKSKYERAIDTNTTVIHSRSQFALGAEFTAYFHLIRKDWVHLSLGPQVSYTNWFKPKEKEDDEEIKYKSYVEPELWLGMPVKVEFYFNERIGMRMTFNTVGFYYAAAKYEFEDDDNTEEKHTDSNMGVRINSCITPTFGFLITF